MKLAVVTPEHPNTPRHGGIARYLRDYVPLLAEKAEVTLVSIEDGPCIDGVPQEVLPPCRLPSPRRPPWYSGRITKILGRLQPDCVEYANWLGLGCRDDGLWAKVVRLSTPVVHGTLRPGLLPKLARPWHHRWELLTVRNANLLISNTRENLKTCRKVYGTDKSAVVIPHGLAFTRSAPVQNAQDVLFIGRFEDRKGVDLLLQAWCNLAAHGFVKNRFLHLVGRDMPGRSGSYLSDCLEKIGKAPEDIGIKIAGDLDDQQLGDLRRECSIAVIPSRYESFGMVALEAFAAGQAVVASDAGGLKEVVDDGKSGILFASGDVDSLADALQSVFTDHERISALATEGQRQLKEKFSPDIMVRASLEAYETAVKLSQRRPGE